MTNGFVFVDLDVLRDTVHKMQYFFDHPNLILLVEPLASKSRITVMALNEIGYFNIKVLKDVSELLLQLKNGKPCAIIILDSDIPAHASFKPYLFFEKSTGNIPKTIFLKEKVAVDSSEVYRAVGALGCIKKPFDAVGFHELIGEVASPQKSDGTIEFNEFGESYLIKLKGIVGATLIAEISEHLTCFAMSEASRCILDCSKLIKIEPVFEKKVKSTASTLLQVNKSLEIFDPKNRLAEFNLENIEAIEFV